MEALNSKQASSWYYELLEVASAYAVLPREDSGLNVAGELAKLPMEDLGVAGGGLMPRGLYDCAWSACDRANCHTGSLAKKNYYAIIPYRLAVASSGIYIQNF